MFAKLTELVAMLPISERLAGLIALTIALSALVAFLLIWCRIFSKSGHAASLGFLMLVPGVNVFLMLLLAFGTWPIERELKARRKGRVA